MKASNKNKLKKLEKFPPQANRYFRKIIYDPKGKFPQLEGDGVYLCLPDNGRRFLPH